MTDTSAIKIRRDLMFRLSYSGSDNVAFHQNLNTSIKYEICDFIVKVTNKRNDRIRYGMLVDIEDAGALWENCYLLEIPTVLTSTKEVENKQIDIIKKYIIEMRAKWNVFYKAFKKNDQKEMTIDEFDNIQRTISSADGRWQLLRTFRKNSKYYKPFTTSLLGTQYKEHTKETMKKELLKMRMSFFVGEEYSIDVDWAFPYICFNDDRKIAHFKMKNESAGLDKIYYPFHDFSSGQNKDLNLDNLIKVDEYNTFSSDSPGISLKPNFYTLFSYYTYLIDEIEKLKQENVDELKVYYNSIVNLNIIREKMLNNSPLKDMQDQDIENLIVNNMERWKNREGGTIDSGFLGSEEGNIASVACGLHDIDDTITVFTEIIKDENVNGRNKKRSEDIEFISYQLFKSMNKETNKFVKPLFENLWAFNKDIFGFDLFFEKANNLISQSEHADAMIENYMKDNLFEHKVLNEPTIGANDEKKPNPFLWENAVYRSDVILPKIWLLYNQRYDVIKNLKNIGENADISKRITDSTPHSGQVNSNFLDNHMPEDPLTNRGTSNVSDILPHNRNKALANYLLGGNKIDNIGKMEEEIAKCVDKYIGTKIYKDTPFAKLEQLHSEIYDIKYKFLKQNDIDIKGSISHLDGSVLVIVNLLIFNKALNELSKHSTIENHLKLYTVAFSVVSDVGNLAASRFFGVQATLSKKALSKISHVAARKSALTLGRLEFAAGGVGGVLGIVWSAYDCVSSLTDRRYKDSILDSISGIGCGISMVGLLLDSTVIGIVPGLTCNVIGTAIILASQFIKYNNSWSGEIEDTCQGILGDNLELGGMGDMEKWFEEFEQKTVRLQWLSNDEIREIGLITKRVKEFIYDMDTYDYITVPNN